MLLRSCSPPSSTSHLPVLSSTQAGAGNNTFQRDEFLPNNMYDVPDLWCKESVFLQDEIRPSSTDNLALIKQFTSPCLIFGAENVPSCRMKSGPTAWITLPIRNTDTRSRPSRAWRPASDTGNIMVRIRHSPSRGK
eukprot:1151441-Pelagomonas_calceolata.AAC.3